MAKHIPLVLATLILAVSPSAQGLLSTRGQVVAERGDSPIGLSSGEVFSPIPIGGPFGSAVMSLSGDILFRGSLAGGTVTSENNRALFIGRTKGDLHLVVRTDNLDPSGTHPNSRLLQVSASTGSPLGSDLFSTQRLSPQGGILLFGAQLYDGGNPGLDGLIHTSAMGNVNDTVIYHGSPGALHILAQQHVTTMPGGAALTSPFSSFSQQSTSLNSAGTAIFKSDLAGGDVTGAGNDKAWILGTPGNLSYFLREGDAMLGGDVVIGDGQLGTNCVLNEVGQVLHDERFSGTLGNVPATQFNDEAVFVTTAGVHALLMREGDTAPDATGVPMVGVTYGSPSMVPGFSASGKTAFFTTLNGAVTPDDDGAFFSGSVGAMQLVVREGDPAPVAGGKTFAVLSPIASYTEGGGIVFGGTLAAVGGVNVHEDSVLCVGKPGSVVLIAREGTQAPGLTTFCFGSLYGDYNFGSVGPVLMNERGQILFSSYIHNGSYTSLAAFSYDPLNGVQLQLMIGNALGATMVTDGVGFVGNPYPSGDSSPLSFNQNGDFVIQPLLWIPGSLPMGNGVVRGHVGSFIATPSAIDAVAGGTQSFTIDTNPTLGNSLYVILGSQSGTRPGWPSPLGPQTIQLNFDGWTNLSLSLANSAIYTNSLSFTDVHGKGTACFNLPPALPGLQGITLHHSVTVFDFFTLASTFTSEPASLLLY